MIVLIVAIAIAASAGIGLTVYGIIQSRIAAGPSAVALGTGVSGGWDLATLRERLRHSLEPTLAQAARSARTAKLEADLLSADWKLRPYEFRLLQGVVAFALGLLGLLRFGISLPVLVLAVIGWVAPSVYLRNRQGRRLRSFEIGLPRAMEVIANSVKAGQSVAQAMEAVAENSGEPIAEEFRVAAAEVQLGATVEHALDNMAKRLDSKDLRLVVMVVGITHTVGGNLPAILTTLADTMRQRDEMRAEVLTATAQSRASSLIITLMPVAAGGFLFFVTPQYFTPMLVNPVGWAILTVAAVLLITGNLIIRRMTAVV